MTVTLQRRSALAAFDVVEAHGWHVAPVVGERPLVDVRSSTADPSRLHGVFARWPGAGVGVDLERSRLAVVDVPANVDWEQLTARHGDVSTLASRLGNRQRLWFRLLPCDAFRARRPFGLRVRTSGIAAAPPSSTGDGTRWRWVTTGCTDAEPAPSWLLDERETRLGWTSWPADPHALLRIPNAEAERILTEEVQRISRLTPSPGLPELRDAAVLYGKLLGAGKINKQRGRGMLELAARRSGVSDDRASRAISSGTCIGLECVWRAVLRR